MSNIKNVMGQAANTLTKPLNVEDVFSTYLYESSNSVSPVTLTNNIDLSGEGGMVWVKSRNDTSGNGWPHITDTERGAGKRLITSMTNASNDSASFQVVDQFNSNGFRYADGNGSTYDYASWTFRKAPKFFDVVTWSGDSTSGRTISHNLGSTPGMIIVKRTNGSYDWVCQHRSLSAGYVLYLNLTSAQDNNPGAFTTTLPTSTVFTVGDNNKTNETGGEYVAYLFAHNDGDGGFGPNGDADIIKCGSYTGNGSTDGPEIDLGFEPQWLLWKNADGTDNWEIADIMRGMPADGSSTSMRILRPNTSAAEFSDNETEPQPTGFKITNPGGNNNDNGSTYIYIAIRRGPMAVPESATEVFDVDAYNGNSPGNNTTVQKLTTGFAGDMALIKARNAAQGQQAFDKLRGSGAVLTPSSTAAEEDFGSAYSGSSVAFNNTELVLTGSGTSTGSYNNSAHNLVAWMWKRAPGYFDVVAYTGNSTAGRTVSHNLGVVPEMMWVKSRGDAESWCVYHAGITNPEQNYLYLNESSSLNPNGNTIRYWNHTAPTDAVFTLGDEDRVNQTADNYIAYLFASLPGISKVGSYTGNGSSQTIDCGFTSGARFVLIKSADDVSAWLVYDTERGITTSNDPFLQLNSTAAETSFDNLIEPDSSGFKVRTADDSINISGSTYIFYAIA